MTATETEAKKAQIKERMAARKLGQKPTAGQTGGALRELFGNNAASSHPTVLNGDVVRKTKKPGGSSAAKKILIGIAIYLIVVFGGVFGLVFGNFLNVLDDIEWGFGPREMELVPEPIEAPAVDIEWAAPEPVQGGLEETPLEDWERTVEGVKAAGVACTGYGHFKAVYNEDLRDVFENCVEDAGFRLWEETVYSYNSQMDFASWYETAYEFAIDLDDDYIGTIEIETDTATGELHGFSVYSSDEDEFLELLNVTLKFMQEASIAERELPSAEEFYEEARWKNEDAQREMGFVMLNGMEVSCYVPDELAQDFFSISMYAPGYMSSEE